MTRILKSFQDQTQFSGLKDDDLENATEIYSSIAHMCDATSEEMQKAMFLLLKGSAFSLFTRKVQSYEAFEQGGVTIYTWSDSTGKQSWSLREWNAM